MHLEDYRAARHHRLVEIAIGLGVPADRAAAVVDRVIEDQRRRILRSADPDEVVVPALHDEVLGGRPRRPTLVIAALVAVVAAAFAIPLLTGAPDPDQEVERTAATVPPLVGLTATEAVSVLGTAGIAARVDPVPQCDPPGQVLGSVPPSGGAVRAGQVVTVVATVTPTWSCPDDSGARAAGWAFLRFLVSGSTPPRLADEVRLYVDGAASGTADGSQPATSSDWRWRVRDPVVAGAVRPVANDLGQPVISITRGRPPRTTCGRPTPRPSGVVPDPTRVVLTGGPEDDCPLTIDLYEDDDGAIAVVSVVLPGGVGLGPPAWVQTRDDLDALDAPDEG